MELRQFLVIAKGSCAEVRLLLYAALDVGYIYLAEFNGVNDLAMEVGRIIGGAVRRQKEITK